MGDRTGWVVSGADLVLAVTAGAVWAVMMPIVYWERLLDPTDVRVRPLWAPSIEGGGDATGGDVVHVAGDAHLG